MEIRLGNDKDIQSVFELQKLFLAPFSLEQVKYEFLENPTSVIYVAIEDEKVVGFIDFWITFDSATICQIAVDKNFQNKGIATSLLTKSVEHLKKEKVIFYTLEVREENKAAISFYIKMGFEYVTKKIKYYTNGDNALYMLKGLI